MGSVAALVVAIASGFNQALIVGAGLYLLACVFILRGKGLEDGRERVAPAVSQSVP
jgi:hypothetical protein